MSVCARLSGSIIGILLQGAKITKNLYSAPLAEQIHIFLAILEATQLSLLCNYFVFQLFHLNLLRLPMNIQKGIIARNANEQNHKSYD